jgi:hypothetical protein
MRHIVFIAALSLASACATTPDSADELARANSEARGGAATIEAVRGIDIELTVQEGDMNLEAHYRANREGCMRIDVSAGGAVVFTEALTQTGGWNKSPDMAAPAPNSDAGNAALRHGVEGPLKLFGLHEFAARGHRLARMPDETIDGALFHRLDAAYSDGYRAELYLDPQTHLIARIREHKPLHVDIDPTAKRIETRLSDYRPAAGVLYPFLSEEVDLETGEVVSRNRIARLEANTEEALSVCASQPPA